MGQLYIDNDDDVQAFVRSCGVTSDDNYVLVHRRTTGWKAVLALASSYHPERFDEELSTHEPFSIIIFTPEEIIIQAVGDDSVPARRIPTQQLQDFGYQLITDQHTFHFTVAGKREDYYAFTDSRQSPAYTSYNFEALVTNQFYGLTAINWQVRESQRTSKKSATTRHTDVVSADDIPASARPERERRPFSWRGLLGGGPRKRS